MRPSSLWTAIKADGKITSSVSFNSENGTVNLETGTVMSNGVDLSRFKYKFDEAGNATQCATTNPRKADGDLEIVWTKSIN